MLWRATPQKPKPITRISSLSGRTPTLTSRLQTSQGGVREAAVGEMSPSDILRLHASCISPVKLSTMNFSARQKKLREELHSTAYNALLISHLPNVRYLCGFTGSAGLLFVEESGSVFFTDVR